MAVGFAMVSVVDVPLAKSGALDVDCEVAVPVDTPVSEPELIIVSVTPVC